MKKILAVCFALFTSNFAQQIDLLPQKIGTTWVYNFTVSERGGPFGNTTFSNYVLNSITINGDTTKYTVVDSQKKPQVWTVIKGNEFTFLKNFPTRNGEFWPSLDTTTSTAVIQNSLIAKDSIIQAYIVPDNVTEQQLHDSIPTIDFFKFKVGVGVFSRAVVGNMVYSSVSWSFDHLYIPDSLFKDEKPKLLRALNDTAMKADFLNPIYAFHNDINEAKGSGWPWIKTANPLFGGKIDSLWIESSLKKSDSSAARFLIHRVANDTLFWDAGIEYNISIPAIDTVIVSAQNQYGVTSDTCIVLLNGATANLKILSKNNTQLQFNQNILTNHSNKNVQYFLYNLIGQIIGQGIIKPNEKKYIERAQEKTLIKYREML